MSVERQDIVYEITTNHHVQNTVYIIRAGSAIGIMMGAEFAVYAERPPVSTPPLGVLIVSNIQASVSTLIPKPGLPQFSVRRPGYALQIQSGHRSEFVNIAIQPGLFEDPDLMHIFSSNVPQGMRLVNDRKDADLVLNKNHAGIGFEILDNACADYGLHHTARSRYQGPDDIVSLLHAVAHFYSTFAGPANGWPVVT